MTSTSTRTRLVVGLAFGALALTACSSGGSTGSDASATTSSSSSSPSSSASSSSAASSPASPSASNVSSASSSPSRAATPSTSSAASPSAAAGPVACRTSGLRAGVRTGGGAAGSAYFEVRLTNTSSSPCRISGFGGVSLVTSPTGQPLGAPADRVHRSAVTRVTLAPGHTATATLQQATADNYSSATCHPVAATGLRIYPPNQTASLYVQHRATACRSTSTHLLSLSPYRVAG